MPFRKSRSKLAGRGIAGAAILPLAAVVLAACGSSSSSTGTATPSSANSTAPASKTTGAPLILGVACSCSGPAASAFLEVPTFIQAWTKWDDSQGGVEGHPIEVKLLDDAGAAATALQNAKALVQQDHVQAIVDMSNQDAAFQKYVETAGVPVVGGASYNSPAASSPDWFPTGGNLIAVGGYGLGAEAKAAGGSKYGVMYCAEAPVCGTFSAPFAKSLQTAVGGMSLAYNASIAASAPSYTAQCLAAKQAGVNALFIGDTPAVIPRVLTDCAQQGYTPKEYNLGGDVAQSVVQDSQANGMTVLQYSLPISVTSNPAGQLFHQIVDTYAPGIKSSPAYDDSLMWLMSGLQLFRTVALAQHLTPTSTPADVKTGLYGLKNETLGGIMAPTTYVKGKPTLINCWFTETVTDGKLLATSATPQCVPPDKVAALFKAFS